MRKTYYQLSYSGAWEGYKRFYKLARLIEFINKIPPHELKNTCPIMRVGNFAWVGMYYQSKNGLRVKFR